uniref:NADH dehydrogenase subunit 6 n=1 Tax=Macropodaphis sp. YW-2015 TaxID=1667255 RepID=A0A1L1YMZ0_9HEMI|nr:NADH dehydrogenase subunit 6 [Macropodaphis sp. YW-2015]
MNLPIFMINLILTKILTMKKPPLSSHLNILDQPMFIIILTNMFNNNSWISYTLFILYVGGLIMSSLHIFSIAFNELNIIKNKKYMLFKNFSKLKIFYFMKNFIILENFKFENKLLFEDNFYLLNMFILPNNMLIYFILIILFFMLILIIWLLKNNKGPIRQKKY